MFTVTDAANSRMRLRVALTDFLGLTSMVTGVLAARGVSIYSGSVRISGPAAVCNFIIEPRGEPDWEAVRKELDSFATRIRAGENDLVRAEINTRLVEFLRGNHKVYSDRLYPIDLKIDQEKSRSETVIEIRTQDTPGFLYELTNALAMLSINIARLDIVTERGEIRDRLWVTGESGRKITETGRLRAIQWAILLMKQFTHLLPMVPEPAAALDKLVRFGKALFDREDFDTILLTLKKSRTLKGLSRILGTSPFLWEEFIRLQHAPILRIIGDRRLLKGRKSRSMMRRELARRLVRSQGFAAKADALNEYKDRELFRIDLRHLLGKTSYLQEFAEEFTDLAEAVAEAAHALAFAETLKKYPAPMTRRGKRGKRSEAAILALGKFGGRELGYASDLELIFVYTDAAEGSALASSNLRFYSEYVAHFCSVIRARQEGVFEIDMRLRPYGKAGPTAVSENLFRKYYAAGGKAMNFERQSFVKLRAIAGSSRLGREVEAVRDDFVYAAQPFDFKEAAQLRDRQRNELVGQGEINAKYGAGGLLDVEYATQTLQIVYGRTMHSVREPNTLRALDRLRDAGVLSPEALEPLRDAYVFMRHLINALRIFRGNARDLNVPEAPSREFGVLARRMGYEGTDSEVRLDFERDLIFHMDKAAALYATTMRDLENSESKLYPGAVTVILDAAPQADRVDIDEILDGTPNEESRSALRACGFYDPDALLAALSEMRRAAPPEAFREAVRASWTRWQAVADPDMAAANLLSFARAAGPDLWRRAADAEEKLGPLLAVFGSSRYLSQTLIIHPEYAGWALDRQRFSLDAARTAAASRLPSAPDALREFRHRETLRIAMAETLCGAPIGDVFRVFSELADRILNAVMRSTVSDRSFAVLGLGKLGGRELNFSSDVDLILLGAPRGSSVPLLDGVRDLLDTLTDGGPGDFLYRVDLRLRPGGSRGPQFMDPARCIRYYRTQAAGWELQALIKARAVAGDLRTARRVLAALRPLVYRRRFTRYDLTRLRVIKRRFEEVVRVRGEEHSDVKMGLGGIRDIEFTVQTLQLMHGRRRKEMTAPNTFDALDRIRELRLLEERECRTLRTGLVFLRRIENRLQLFENRQTFLIPGETADLRRLARSMGFFDGAAGRAEERFGAELMKTKRECRVVFEKVFYGR